MQHPKQRQNISAYIKAAKEIYNPDNFPPRFSFRFLVKYSNFGYESLNNEQKIALIDTLNRLSQLKWAELRLAPRHGLGYEKIEKNALSFALPYDIPADRSIIAFRFYGKAPMIGYRSAYGTFFHNTPPLAG
ncbi:MAG: hypothetical protein LBC85_05865 [Fibromonadaceae bacterium]|jgi:hypothetical protein|nr:hypothetical protein [Fibromonadaceae bacterium]